MRKRTEVIWAVVLIVVIIIIFAVVVNNSPTRNSYQEQDKSTRKFELIDKHYIGDDISFTSQYFFYDPETMVIYTCMGDNSPLTMVVESDGSPKIYVPKNMK